VKAYHYFTMIPTKFRYIERGLFDRVIFLLQNNKLDDTKLNDDLNIVLKLLQITVNNINKNKFNIILKKIEKKLLKKSNYNLVIRNIPRYAVSVSTRTEVPVTYQSLRDTINQFGDIKSMYINYGVSFIKMSNNESTHALLNNMELGNNIISTEVI